MKKKREKEMTMEEDEGEREDFLDPGGEETRERSGRGAPLLSLPSLSFILSSPRLCLHFFTRKKEEEDHHHLFSFPFHPFLGYVLPFFSFPAFIFRNDHFLSGKKLLTKKMRERRERREKLRGRKPESEIRR